MMKKVDHKHKYYGKYIHVCIQTTRQFGGKCWEEWVDNALYFGLNPNKDKIANILIKFKTLTYVHKKHKKLV